MTYHNSAGSIESAALKLKTEELQYDALSSDHFASNLEQAANLLGGQANSSS